MRKASFTNSSYAVEWTVRAVRDTESEPEPPSDDIPVLEMGTLACTESSGLYTSARQSDLIVRDAATALGNASVDVGDTILVGGPQVLKCKAREKTVGGCTKQCDGLHGSQLNPQADGTIICLSAEKDSASMANAARDEYPPIYPTQGIISNAGHSLGDRVPHSPTSWTASGFPTVDTVSNGLSDGIQNGTFEWVPVADGVAQQSLQVKKHMSTSLYQELTHTAEGQTLEDHSPRKRYASAPAADTRYRRGITGSCTPQCIEEPPQLLEIDMLSGCSSPLSTCRSSVVLDWEGDILASQGETNTQITRVNEPPTVDEPSVKNRVSKRLLGLKREAHASMSPHPPAVPSKRTGDWPDQAGDKFEERSERANLEDASSAHQPAHRKRAKKVQAARECGASIGRENQGQVREDLGVNGGSGENSGGETIAVASFPEEQTFSAAKQAQRDGLIAASYDLHSVRKVDGRWLVRNRCDACAKIQTWNCNRASPCNVCEKKGLICGERPWVPARGARPRPSSGPIADTQHARTPRPRKIRLKLSNPKEATMGEGNRPYPRGLPEVWSVGRQALCETLIYYRAYQSGAYTHDDLSFGFLVDKQCGERDYMDNEVVITRAGGGLKRNPETGEMEQVVDHNLKSKTVENFLNNKRNFCPVALIVGKGNPKCPTQIPFNYCVLGWFKVTDVWCEKIDGMKCFKFRFEKLDLELPSWWAPAGSPDPPRPYRYPKPAVRRTCNSCGESSPEIYIEGWICFTDNCESFWKINGAYPPANLHYNPAFLEERTRWPSKVKAPYSLKPAMLPEDRGNDSGYSVSHACWKGFSCPKCGRCNSREDWNGWECQTDECDYTYKVKRSILSAQAISNPHDPITDGHAISKDLISCPITEKVDFLENYRVHTYAITDCGTVTHFMANRTINERPDGPDDMFLALQQADIGLKRFPLKNSTLTGPMLAQHFAVNHGMPYKYVIDVDSKSFAEAPMTMHHARARLNWAGEYVVKDGSFRMFNELLTLGYFEKQKINYHDDGEEGLGPTIATLSLGGQATMTIRMKASHYHGVSRTGAYVDKHPPTKGCLNYEQRLLRHQEMEQLDPKMRSLLCKEIVKDLGLSRKRSSPVWLSMRLNHGDIVVMHGVKIQTYYEVRGALWKAVYGVLADRLCCQHAVEPHGKLRFAMTCRYIDPATVNSYHWWKADYENQDQIKAYDGDEFAKQQPISPPSSSPLPPSVQLVSSSPPPSPPLPPSSLPLHSPPPLPSPSSSLPPPIQLSPTLPSYHQEIASSQATKQISSQDP